MRQVRHEFLDFHGGSGSDIVYTRTGQTGCVAGTPRELLDRALDRLGSTPGFVERPAQRQLALLLSDLIEGMDSGVFEAPTGLGKSLAVLLPALAHAAFGKRVVVATYTNVLAEQYWRKDVPVAQSLVEAEQPATVEFLIGRQRYACLAAADGVAPPLARRLCDEAELGIETEFRKIANRPPREAAALWTQIAAPPVCPGRMCDRYDACFYYRARRRAEKAGVVVTNHSVVLQDAQLRAASGGGLDLLGQYDFLVLDEAHDFPSAAENALEFVLDEGRIRLVLGLIAKLDETLRPLASLAGCGDAWGRARQDCVATLEKAPRELGLAPEGIVELRPRELDAVPSVAAARAPGGAERATAAAQSVATALAAFLKAADRVLDDARDTAASPMLKDARDAMRTYHAYLGEFALGCDRLPDPEGVAVTHSRPGALRTDTIDLAEPLRMLFWGTVPAACLSATLAVDGHFEHFKGVTGFETAFEEVLPSPFDHMAQSALYVPPPGRIPDPGEARRSGEEAAYYDAVAQEVAALIRAVGGGTLALFHSRREMEEVFARVKADFEEAADPLPLLIQRTSGVASTGERFRNDVAASLFALRSFWTGFDAPGDTLRCVILVRVPFEVPVEPPQIVRMAWLQSRGVDGFVGHSLPNATMLVRQGAGRLIRSAEDRGVVALLDPRLISKRYGERILANLPAMRRFDDPLAACAHVGIDPANHSPGAAL